MSFDSTKTSLKDLLCHVHEGKLQLPEFQRDYVWNEGDVRSLLESIAKGFPVGALLTLGWVHRVQAAGDRRDAGRGNRA